MESDKVRCATCGRVIEIDKRYRSLIHKSVPKNFIGVWSLLRIISNSSECCDNPTYLHVVIEEEV